MGNILLDRRAVERLTGLSRSSVYRLMRTADFPAPVRVGPRAVRWYMSEIVEYVNSRPRATGEAA